MVKITIVDKNTGIKHEINDKRAIEQILSKVEFVNSSNPVESDNNSEVPPQFQFDGNPAGVPVGSYAPEVNGEYIPPAPEPIYHGDNILSFKDGEYYIIIVDERCPKRLCYTGFLSIVDGNVKIIDENVCNVVSACIKNYF